MNPDIWRTARLRILCWWPRLEVLFVQECINKCSIKCMPFSLKSKCSFLFPNWFHTYPVGLHIKHTQCGNFQWDFKVAFVFSCDSVCVHNDSQLRFFNFSIVKNVENVAYRWQAMLCIALPKLKRVRPELKYASFQLEWDILQFHNPVPTSLFTWLHLKEKSFLCCMFLLRTSLWLGLWNHSGKGHAI